MELEETIEKTKALLNLNDLLFEETGTYLYLGNQEKELIQILLNHLTKQEKMIEEIKSKLEEHIQHCKQEARGSLHNEICHISLKFDETLLNIIENKAGESE